MNWLLDLYRTNPTVEAIAMISLVCMAGMVLGSVKLRGVGLGTSGVLFAGILVGSISHPIDHSTLVFVKEFGLILFVFCIGLQLGPGFVASVRQMGPRLHLMAAGVVLLGSLLAPVLAWLLGLDYAAALGVLAGATTNRPSLGAAQQTLAQLPGVSAERAALPALAYAVTYPAAILGIIATIILLKRLMRIDPVQQAEAFAAEQNKAIEPLVRRALVIDNPNLEGISVNEVPGGDAGVVISRIKRRGSVDVQAATGSALLHTGDTILAVGTQRSGGSPSVCEGRGWSNLVLGKMPHRNGWHALKSRRAWFPGAMWGTP
jgi:putative transport protein